MKNIMIIAAAVAGLSSVGATAQAQDNTIRIQGAIAPVCTIATGADVSGVSLTGITPLGNLDITCNDDDGFAITYRAELGSLADENGDSPTTFDYTITDGSTTVNPSTTEQNVNASSLALLALDGHLIPISMNVISASGPAWAGSYRDYVYFGVTAY